MARVRRTALACSLALLSLAAARAGSSYSQSPDTLATAAPDTLAAFPDTIATGSRDTTATASRDSMATVARDTIANIAPPKWPAPLFPIVERERWGYIDRQGNIVIRPRYTRIASVDQDWLVGQTLPWRQRPRAVDLFLAPSVRPESASVVAVRTQNRWGFLNRREELVSPRFDQVGLFREGFAPVRTAERWGFVNTLGLVSVETRYQGVGDFRGGYAVIIDQGRCGVIDTTGRAVVRARFDRVVPGDSMFHYGRMLMVMDGKKGFVRRDGTIAIPARFQDAGQFREGLASVALLTGFGFVDTTGGWVVSARYEEVKPFDGGMAWVRRGGVFGLIDVSGKFVVTPQFEEVSSFHGGRFAAVRRNKVFGWIDRSGNWIQGQGAELARIDDTLRVMRLPWGGVAFVVLPQLRTLTQLDADDFEPYSEGLAAVSRKGEPIGFVDGMGLTRIAPRFDRVDRFRAGLCRAVAGDTLGYIDSDGRWVWQSHVRGFGKRNATR